MQFKLLPRLHYVVIFIAVVGKQMKTEALQITIKKIILTICLPVMVGNKKKTNTCYIKVYKATRRKTRHGLMLLWLKDLMNVTVKLQSIEPIFRHSSIVPSLRQVISEKIKGPLVSATRSPLMKALNGSVETLGL